ncbi:MAG: CaiB/BaiF CoA-transferase family protein [Proteobacteria bacterium]|nr:CaiB/BaiF CoA-transferase family protein [Pseudomonadota bacterium]
MKLNGIKVLDLSRFLPGPYMGLLMADHGAEVIKIENFEGEPTRHLGPKVAGFSAYFRNTQRGKLSLRLNLKANEGRDIFLQLADQTDVIIDSFRPGVVDRLDIGYAAISERNPRIIYCSLSAFGQEGSLAQRPSHDVGAQALTGTLSLMQQDGRPPSLPASPTADVALGSLALVGILMALYRREKTGIGDFIDMSMTDSLMSWNPHIISSVLAEGEAPELENERLYGGAAFYNVYRTSDDRHLVLSGAEMNFVENLLNALQRPDLIEVCKRPWGPAQDPVKEFLNETFATRSLLEWDRWLGTLGICYAPVLNLNEAWQQEYLRERGMISVGSDGVERLDTPVRFKNEPAQISDKLAELGADTDALLERLGYDAQQRQALKDKGVC